MQKSFFLKIQLILSLSFFVASLQAQTVEEKISKTQTKIETFNKSIINLNVSLEDLRLEKVRNDIKQFALPKTNATDTIVNHLAYFFQYDENHEQPKWVAHAVPVYVIDGNASRSNDFRPDSAVATGSAVKEDYWNSGYDRGHLAPSADFRWSKRALSESYYYSNMSPQRPELNRERWAETEDVIRENVIATKEQLFVVTGPVLKDGLNKIGPNGVSVPDHYFKIALDIEGNEKKAIAFVMPNKYCSHPVMYYSVSVDSVEKLTGLDFFYNLDDSLEERLEANVNYKVWQKGQEEGNTNEFKLEDLPKGAINTTDAKTQIGNKATVCGTVVSTKLSEKSGAIFINLDKKFPNSVFSITIWKADRVNFSYKPELELMNKQVCVKGQIQDYQGTPSMYIKNEKELMILEGKED